MDDTPRLGLTGHPAFAGDAAVGTAALHLRRRRLR